MSCGRVIGLAAAAVLLAACQASLSRRPVPPSDQDRPVAATEAVDAATLASPASVAPAPDDAPAVPTASPDNADDGASAESPSTRTGAQVFAHLRERFDADECAEIAARNPSHRNFLRHGDALSRQLARALPLLDFVDRRVEALDLPAEFALVPLVESGYRADALGRGKPAGLWQLIPSTARNHGVRFAPGFDGRLSPLDSTRAALSYLKTLQAEFESWQEIAMAYNAGENRVRRALKRYGPGVSALGQKPPSLSPVTYHYVAKLEAVACLIAMPPPTFHLPDDEEFAPLHVAHIPDDVTDVDALAEATGMSAQDLHRFNPAYRRKVIDPSAPRDILVPATARDRLALHATQASAPAVAMAATGATPAVTVPTLDRHEVRAGDTLWGIARRYGISLAALLRINGLRADAVLRPGQTLRLAP